MKCVALALTAAALVACGPGSSAQDGGTVMTPVDAGSLGQNLSCQASLVGAAAGAFPCEVTAVFVRGGPNNTTVTITGNTRDRNPEINLSVRIPLEPEPGKSYTWMDDVLWSELLVNDAPAGNSFAASKAQQIDPAAFTFRATEVTGRVATANGGAQLRFTFQLDATLRPTPSSPAPNNTRVTISVTK